MTGQDIQDRVDAIVNDLQTTQKGNGVSLMFRDSTNTPQIFELTADEIGVVNQVELQAIQNFLAAVEAAADDYEQFRAPVTAASDAFRTAQVPHQAVIDAASAANTAKNTALEADANYQAAKTALDAARNDANYINSLTDYKNYNVSENYAELAAARGNYYPFVDGQGYTPGNG